MCMFFSSKPIVKKNIHVKHNYTKLGYVDRFGMCDLHDLQTYVYLQLLFLKFFQSWSNRHCLFGLVKCAYAAPFDHDTYSSSVQIGNGMHRETRSSPTNLFGFFCISTKIFCFYALPYYFIVLKRRGGMVVTVFFN